MKRIIVCLIALFLLMGISAVPLRVHGDYTQDIYINNDGSIFPSDAPLNTFDNLTYVLIEDLSGSSIKIERDNIILDGTNHAIRTTVNPFLDYSRGILSVGNRKNVTIENCYVKGFYHGISVSGCMNWTIKGSIVTENIVGIMSLSSNYTTISNNTLFLNSGFGIGFNSSNFVNIFNNYFSGSTICVSLYQCNNNRIETNQIDNSTCDVSLYSSNQTTLSQNKFTGNSPNNSSTVYTGVDIEYSEENNVTENKFTALTIGASTYFADHNNISNNTFLSIANTGSFLQAIDSSDNTFVGNNVTNVGTGFNLQQFSTSEMTTNNTICQNTITNSMFNVVLGNASGNLFFHNNFVNSTYGLNIFYPNSTLDSWDNGVEGNYWSDYNGTDSNQDGIGDTPYPMHQRNIVYQNNTDHYPLMGYFGSFNVPTWSQLNYVSEKVDVISNFTISDLGLLIWLTTPNQYLQAGQLFLSLTPVQGQDMTSGFCRMTLPNNILNASEYTVLINMTPIGVNKLAMSNNTQTTLYFTFNTSPNEIIIVPEFPFFLILPLLFMAILLTVIFCRKKLTRTA